MSVHRLPNGNTVFLCGRGAGSTLRQWIENEARKQGRCSRCLEKIGAGCVAERAESCRNDIKPDAAAVAVLKGMVAG